MKAKIYLHQGNALTGDVPDGLLGIYGGHTNSKFMQITTDDGVEHHVNKHWITHLAVLK